MSAKDELSMLGNSISKADAPNQWGYDAANWIRRNAAHVVALIESTAALRRWEHGSSQMLWEAETYREELAAAAEAKAAQILAIKKLTE